MPRLARATALLSAAAFLLLAAPLARATDPDSVDLQLAGSATIKGTIRSAQERESFVLVLPKGAKVKAVARRRGRGRFVPRLELILGDPSFPTIVPNTTVRTRRGVTTLTSPALTESGTYRVRIFGNGVHDGDYLLNVVVSYRPGWTGYGTAIAAEAGLASEFGAPAGTRAQVTLSPRTKTSKFVPALDSLDGPGAFTRALTGGKSPWIRLGAAGTYSTAFHEGGAIGGAWKCGVALRLPRVRKSRIDISAARLTGNFVDHQQVYGVIVGGGGGIVDPPNLGGPLDGASVTIPGGALPFPVVITMAEGASFTLPGGGHPAGPVVQFGPPGTSFHGLNASVTLPYDPADFEGGDPVTDLTVYVRNDSTGVVEPVLPRDDYDFTVPGFVTFPAAHFSRYVPGGSGPRSVTGEWIAVTVEASPQPDYGGAASITVGSLTFFDQTAQYSGVLPGLASQWFRAFDDGGGGGPAPRIDVISPFDSEFGTFRIESDAEVVVTPISSQDPPVTFLRGRSPDVLFRRPDLSSRAEVSVLLRKARGLPTSGNVAGRWHAFFCAIGGASDARATPPVLDLYASAGRTTMVFSNDGRIAFEGTSGRDAETNFPQGGWTSKPADVPRTATYRLNDGVLVFEVIDPKTSEPETSIRLWPCLDGDVLVGAQDNAGDDSLLLFLVRESTGRTASMLAGRSSMFTFAASVVDRSLKDTASGFDLSTTSSDMVQGPPLNLTITPQFRVAYVHDAVGTPTISPSGPLAAKQTTFTFDPDGGFKTASGLRGAVSPGRDLFLAVLANGRRFELSIGPPGRDVTTTVTKR